MRRSEPTTPTQSERDRLFIYLVVEADVAVRKVEMDAGSFFLFLAWEARWALPRALPGDSKWHARWRSCAGCSG